MPRLERGVWYSLKVLGDDFFTVKDNHYHEEKVDITLHMRDGPMPEDRHNLYLYAMTEEQMDALVAAWLEMKEKRRLAREEAESHWEKVRQGLVQWDGTPIPQPEEGQPTEASDTE